MTIVKAFFNKNIETISDISLSIVYMISLLLSSYSQTHNNQEYALNIFTTPVSFLYVVNLIISISLTGLIALKKKNSQIYYLQFILIYNHIISAIIINHPEIGKGVKINVFFVISIALSILLILKVYPKLYLVREKSEEQST